MCVRPADGDNKYEEGCRRVEDGESRSQITYTSPASDCGFVQWVAAEVFQSLREDCEFQMKMTVPDQGHAT